MKDKFSPFPALVTQRLRLRQTLKTDAKEVLFSRSDKEMNKYICRVPPVNIKEAEDFVDKITKGVENGENINWSITLNGNPKMIGSICLWNFSPDKKIAEVGYDLHTHFQHQGIMDEALKRVLIFGFEDLKLNHIEAFTHHLNESSKKLLLNNNFSHIENRKDKGYPNNIIFELKNPQLPKI